MNADELGSNISFCSTYIRICTIMMDKKRFPKIPNLYSIL